jgi:hypothetical protein
MIFRVILFATALGLSACTQFPQLDATLEDTDKDAPYPRLFSKSAIEQGTQRVTITPEVTQGINDRVAALKARAKAIGATAMTAKERAQLEDAIDDRANSIAGPAVSG